MNCFTVRATSDRFWNQRDFVEFLVKHQRQKIEITVVPEAICLHSLGVYSLLDLFEFSSVTIHTWNPLERHDRYQVRSKGVNFWFDRVAAIDPELHNWDESAVFFCLYHRPTAARLALSSYVQQYSNITHFSTNTDCDSLNQFEFDKLLHYDLASVSRAATVLNQLPMLMASPDRLTAFDGYDYTDTLTKLYRSIFVDIVVESHVLGNTFFPTEKTIRPMLLKKPFVIFASANYLDYLHQMGFYTFNEFWDETYDGYEQGDRLKKIYATIDSIAKKSTAELRDLYWHMKFVLDHNHDLLISKQFNRTIKPI